MNQRPKGRRPDPKPGYNRQPGMQQQPPYGPGYSGILPPPNQPPPGQQQVQYVYVPVPVSQSGPHNQFSGPPQLGPQNQFSGPPPMGYPGQHPGARPPPPPLMSQQVGPPLMNPPMGPGFRGSQGNLNSYPGSFDANGKQQWHPETANQETPSKRNRQRKNKKGQELGQDSQVDTGFEKLKSLLSEEPPEQYRGDRDSCENLGAAFGGENRGGRRKRGGKNRKKTADSEEHANSDEGETLDTDKFGGSQSQGLNTKFAMSSDSIDSVGNQRGNSGRGRRGRQQDFVHGSTEQINEYSQNVRGRGGQRGRGGRGQQQHHDNESTQPSSDSSQNIRGRGGQRGRGGRGQHRDHGNNDCSSEDYSHENANNRGKRGRGGRGGRGGHADNNNDIQHGEQDRQNNRGQQGKRGRGRGQGQTRRESEEEIFDDNTAGLNNKKRNKKKNQGQTEEGDDDTAHRRGSHRGSQEPEDESDIPDVDDIEVFKFMIKTFGGGCTFEDFVKRCNLFPMNSNIARWFVKHVRRFHIYREGRKIVYMTPFYRDAKICTSYNNKNHLGKCDKDICDFFHICRRFVRGNCRQKDCPMSHSFKTRENHVLKNKLGIGDFSDADIKIMLNCNSPSVCVDYLYNNGCKVPNSEKRCPHLHLCRMFIFNKCTEPCKFKLTHSVKQFHNKWVLASCHMKDWPAGRVVKSIYVPPRPRNDTEDYSDDSDLSMGEESESVCGYDSDTQKYSDFIEAESTESLNSNTSNDHLKKFGRLIQSMEKLTASEENTEKVKHSRAGRFKSTDNITCGIVGKDDQDLGTLTTQGISESQETYRFEDAIDIKERERILMEKYLQEQGSSNSVDQKPPVRPRIPRKNPTDGAYQERDQALLTDEADNTNICIHVTKDKCPAKTCKSNHLRSGLPYLWQIKMEGKWLSFVNSENENIEKGFTALRNSVTTKMILNSKSHSICIYFTNPTNPTYGIVYDTDGQSSDNDQKHVVRRLSTPSFAEKKMSSDCYLTQWRWYFMDDSRQWVLYDKDVFQFTLEKKFVTKQKTYMYTRENFYFMYKVDFLNMTQTNLDTSKCRDVLRRPLFVSKDDVEQKKFPPSITFPAAAASSKPMHFFHWDCAYDFELVELDSAGKEYRDVMKSFLVSMDPARFLVKEIYRVQNRKLWSEYDTKKKHMIADVEQSGQGQTIAERDLFHGTDSLNTCRGICTNNFDFRTSGRNATLYGEGSYFAVNAKMSHSYTKADSPNELRFLFRAKVLIGQFTKGNPSLRRPPEIPGQIHKLYDSCVDNELNPEIFVVFDRNQCYPEYLFMYTDGDTVPTVPVAQQLVYPHPGQIPPVQQTTPLSSYKEDMSPTEAQREQLAEARRTKEDKCVIQ